MADAKNPVPAPALQFNRVDDLPDPSQLNALTNPFQGEVNRLAKEGGASRFIAVKKGLPVPEGMFGEEEARKLIRSAVQNIKRGVDTKTAPIPDGKGGMSADRVYVYFKVRDKRVVNRSGDKG